MSLGGLLLSGVFLSACGDNTASDSGSAGSANSGGSSGSAAGNAGASNAGAGNAGAGNAGAGGMSGQAGASSTVDPKEEPVGFWDVTDIPVAKNVLTFKFLNRSGGRFTDSQIYWRFEIDGSVELHSIAEMPTYDMPANASGRMYFYICPEGEASCDPDPSKSKYYDFIEHTISANRYNGNTTRVDAFGLKIAMRLHCADGFEETVGEDYGTFAESREITFQKFIDAVPEEFKPLAQAPYAPYRIVEPGVVGFNAGGIHEDYYQSYIDEIWENNGITIPKPGPNGSGLSAYPDLSAAIYRHVGAEAGSFDADGKLLNENLWDDATTFYQSAPAHFYAEFWHTHGIDGKAYGFPYDDVGAYSTYVSHTEPEYLLVAIGF